MSINALPLGRRTFREDIKEFLIDAILNGTLKAGERIVETHIARQLNVSQGPVREALRDLELLGFVESVPFKGTYVRTNSYEELMQIYPIRAAIEGVAAHAAATRITDESLAQLRECFESMLAAAEQHDNHAHAAADIEFHRTFVAASDNHLLFQFWDNMRLATTTFMSAILSHRDLRQLTLRHEPILTALELHDADAAERAARWHIDELRVWILEAGPANRER
jgi:DNA-binding GntR family transcriptional regulator